MESVLFSVSETYFRAAVAELERAVEVHDILRVGPDAGVAELTHGDIRDVYDAPLHFVRHLAAVSAFEPALDEPGRIAALVASLRLPLNSSPPAVQVWESGKSVARGADVREAVVAALGVPVVRSGSPQTLSVCLGEDLTVVALNGSRWSLSDWPGGRLRLAAGPEQISRAEFKLEELFTLQPVPVGPVGLDLGASPGGWTRILRTRGCATVHAVDPADLDPRLAGDPGVIQPRTTAGEFLRATRERFDVVVNDMRMTPERSSRVMVDAAAHLRPGAYGIATLKLDAADAVRQVDRALGILDRAYEIQFARQLQHNRHELTVVTRLR
jgi:23S rRNA (cytidine2498-2'-O)-methyltransferase